MSGIGIESFREAGDTFMAADRRVTVDLERNTVQAPYSFAGRVIAWFQGAEVRQPEGVQNRQVRQAFYDALVKAEGETFANATIERKLGVEARDFLDDSSALMASDISAVIGSADRARARNSVATVKEVTQFLKADGLLRSQGEHPHRQIDFRNPAIQHGVEREFTKLVNDHPDYGRRPLARIELIALGRQATATYCAERQREFTATFPELARLGQPGDEDADVNPFAGSFPDRNTFFDATRATLQAIGEQRKEATDNRQIERGVGLGGEDIRERGETWQRIRGDAARGLDAIEQASKSTADMTTAWNSRARDALPEQIDSLRAVREQLRQASNVGEAWIDASRQDGTASLDEATLLLCRHLVAELDHQIERLEGKQAKLDINRQHDPLSEKNLAYQRLLLAEASHALLVDTLDLLSLRQPIVDRLAELEAISKPSSDNEIEILKSQRAEAREAETFLKLHGTLADMSVADGVVSHIKAGDRSAGIAYLSGLNFSHEGIDGVDDDGRNDVEDRLRRTGLLPMDRRLDQHTRDAIVERLENWGLTPQGIRNLDGPDHDAVIQDLSDHGFEPKLLDYDYNRAHEEREERLLGLGISRGQIESAKGKRALTDPSAGGKGNEIGEMRDLRARLKQLDDLDAPFRDRAIDARRAWEGARSDHRIELPPGSGIRALLDYQLTEERDFIDATLTESISPRNRSRLGLESETLGARIRQARDDILVRTADRTGGLGPIDRQMTVSRGGETHDYGSEMLPVRPDRTNAPDGPELKDLHPILKLEDSSDDIVEIGPRDVTRSQGEIMLSRLTRGDDDRSVLHQSIRYTAPDTSSDDDPMAGCRKMADDVASVAAQQNRRFMQGADGLGGQRLTHVNFHLVTSNRKEQQDQATRQLDAFDDQQRVRLSGEGDDARYADAEVISFAFGVKGTSPDLDGSLRERDRDSMVRLIGDLARGTAPGGLIGDILSRLEAAIDNENERDGERVDDRDEAATLAGQIRWQADQVRAAFGEERRSRIDMDSYAVIGHTMRLIDLSERALDMLGDRSMALTQSQGHHGRRDPGSVVDVEVKAQAIIEDLGGRVGFDHPLSREDKGVYNTVLTGSGQDEMERLTTGRPGMTYAPDMAWRSGDHEAMRQAYGMAQRTDL